MKVLYKRECSTCGEINYDIHKDTMGLCRHCNSIGLKEGEILQGEELRKANKQFEEVL